MRKLVVAALGLLFSANAAFATVSIAPNDAGMYYSPANWNVNATDAITINGGAYFRTVLVSTTTCVLKFNTANMVSGAPSQIYYRVDRYGPFTKATLTNGTATVTVTMPADTTQWEKHVLEVYVKSTTEFQSGATGARWVTPATANNVYVDFQGLTLDNGASVSAPRIASAQVLVMGDSITEGYKSVNTTGAQDTDWEDSTLGYAAQLQSYLGAEIGVVGFGGQGWAATGVGSVPAFTSTYNLLYPGVSRSFSGINLIIINQGGNDGTNNTTTQVSTVLNGLASAGYTGKIIVLEPFPPTLGADQDPFLRAGIAAAVAPSQSVYVATTGFFDTTNSSDGLHPWGSEAESNLAPRVAALLMTYLPGGGGHRLGMR